jgi:hypothetical protein
VYIKKKVRLRFIHCINLSGHITKYSTQLGVWA